MLKFLRDLWDDGHKILGAISPMLSIAFTVAKAFGADFGFLKEISYGWAAAPIVLWLVLAYRNRRSSYLGLIEKYDHAIFLDELNVDCSSNDTMPQRHHFELVIENVSKYPVTYQFKKLNLDGDPIAGNFDNKGGIIRAGKKNRFFTPNIEKPFADTEILQLDITYGPPAKPELRILSLEIKLTRQGDSRFNHRYLKDEDRLLS